MDEMILKKVQKTMLYMAKDIIEVCDRNNITYFLDGGTMLGAVRHKGFIPWDDDFDIGMQRDDYQRFIEIAQRELGERYFVQTAETDEQYGFCFAKVRLENTIYEETAASNDSIHKGFYVDIFPYDHFPDETIEQKRLIRHVEVLKRALLAKTNYPIWKTNQGFSLKRFVSYKLMELMLFLIPKEIIYNHYIEEVMKWNTTDTKELYPQGNSKCGKFHMDKELFNTVIKVPFENESFNILANYDLFLCKLYGDYMILPPSSERGNRHNIKTIVFEEGQE